MHNKTFYWNISFQDEYATTTSTFKMNQTLSVLPHLIFTSKLHVQENFLLEHQFSIEKGLANSV